MQKKYSPLQKDILLFYRKCLKYSNTRGENKDKFINLVKGEFRKNQDISKRNFDRVFIIYYLLFFIVILFYF